ncbi:hypothetical protein [Streptomyces sp. NPDC005485]|uniref:hypothetical protein n=1 Tax=Streptomyces sp. NPDC005485 TaxID=3155591 RepID=UPI0033B591CC
MAETEAIEEQFSGIDAVIAAAEAEAAALPVEPDSAAQELTEQERREHHERRSTGVHRLRHRPRPHRLAPHRHSPGRGKTALKKKPDTVDAWVALSAVKHGSAVIFTSDPEDIEAYLTALSPADVHVQPV